MILVMDVVRFVSKMTSIPVSVKMNKTKILPGYLDPDIVYAPVELNEVYLYTIGNLRPARMRFTSVDVSLKYIIFGSSSGGLYVFSRFPYAFILLIPNKAGEVNKIAISPDEKWVAYSTVAGCVCQTYLGNAPVCNEIYKEKLKCSDHVSKVTAMKWRVHNSQLFVGMENGALYVLNMLSIRTNVYCSTQEVILNLGSPIVQIEVLNNLALVSTYTKTVICDSGTNSYKQIGTHHRNGSYGACFAMSKNKNTIYCARPGHKLWDVDFNANVRYTYIFDTTSVKSYPILQVYEHERFVEPPTPNESQMNEHNPNFTSLFALTNELILTFSDLFIYILDPKKSNILLRIALNSPIIWCKPVNNTIFIFTEDLAFQEVHLLDVDMVITKAYSIHDETLCRYLCREHFQYLSQVSRETELLTKSIKKAMDSPSHENLTDSKLDTEYLSASHTGSEILSTTNSVNGNPNELNEICDPRIELNLNEIADKIKSDGNSAEGNVENLDPGNPGGSEPRPENSTGSDVGNGNSGGLNHNKDVRMDTEQEKEGRDVFDCDVNSGQFEQDIHTLDVNQVDIDLGVDVDQLGVDVDQLNLDLDQLNLDLDVDQLGVDVDQLNLDLDVDQLGVNVDQLNLDLDVDQLGVDINQLNLDLDVDQLDIDQLGIDMDQLDLDVDVDQLEVDQLDVDEDQLDLGQLELDQLDVDVDKQHEQQGVVVQAEEDDSLLNWSMSHFDVVALGLTDIDPSCILKIFNTIQERALNQGDNYDKVMYSCAQLFLKSVIMRPDLSDLLKDPLIKGNLIQFLIEVESRRSNACLCGYPVPNHTVVPLFLDLCQKIYHLFPNVNERLDFCGKIPYLWHMVVNEESDSHPFHNKLSLILQLDYKQGLENNLKFLTKEDFLFIIDCKCTLSKNRCVLCFNMFTGQNTLVAKNITWGYIVECMSETFGKKETLNLLISKCNELPLGTLSLDLVHYLME